MLTSGLNLQEKFKWQINSNLSEKFALNSRGQNSSYEKCRTVSSTFRSVLFFSLLACMLSTIFLF